MTSSSPAAIQDILSCVNTELHKVAERHQMRASAVNLVREHWLRRLTGVCVRCGRTVKKGKCNLCGTTAESSVALLQSLDPKSKLLNYTCEKCKKTFSYTAGQVLKMSETYGVFRPSRLCKKCRYVSPEAPAQQKPAPKAKKQTSKMETKKVEEQSSQSAAEPHEVQTRPTGALTYRPFEALKGMNIPATTRSKARKTPKK